MWLYMITVIKTDFTELRLELHNVDMAGIIQAFVTLHQNSCNVYYIVYLMSIQYNLI